MKLTTKGCPQQDRLLTIIYASTRFFGRNNGCLGFQALKRRTCWPLGPPPAPCRSAPGAKRRPFRRESGFAGPKNRAPGWGIHGFATCWRVGVWSGFWVVRGPAHFGDANKRKCFVGGYQGLDSSTRPTKDSILFPTVCVLSARVFLHTETLHTRNPGR